MMKIAILGAGPAGLSLAYHLRHANIDIDIYDQSDKPGGLATSIQLWNNKVELGPHFLRKGGSPELDLMITSLLNPQDYTAIERNTKILLGKNKFSYPPKPMEILRHLKANQLMEAMLSLLLGQFSFYKAQPSAKDHFIKKMGEFLYNFFVKNYSEKIWGVPPEQLHPNYAENLLPFTTTRKLFKKVLNSFYVKKNEENLWDFPNGFDILWHEVFNSVKEKHNFYMGSKIHKIHHANGHIHGIHSDQGIKQYDFVISTIPAFALLSLLDHSLNSPPPQFRSAFLVYLLVSGDIFHDESCLYLYSEEYKAIRVTNFGTQPDGTSILLMEYWLSDEEVLNQSYFLSLASQEFESINKKPITIVNTHSVLLRKAYRVPNQNLYTQSEEQKRAMENYTNLIPLGRNNTMNFNYGMEQAVTEGAGLAKKLIRRADVDLQNEEARLVGI